MLNFVLELERLQEAFYAEAASSLSLSGSWVSSRESSAITSAPTASSSRRRSAVPPGLLRSSTSGML